ncbi:hypothetical protein [Microbacterium sp.]|uniref:hypothetical protein n=1 Tax=Microbacterium sp. TaxID=51671 RepID=UPI0039E56006
MTSDPTDASTPDASDAEIIEDGVLYDDEVKPEYGIVGFTLREVLIVGVWLVHFVVSFFPIGAGFTLWSTGLEWVLPIGVPTVAVFLVVLRRLSPEGIRRVGSLGIDQFASVAASVAAATLVANLWLVVSTSTALGVWAISWNSIVLVITALALVVLTVFAPLVPGLKEDFQGRLVTLAHRAANPVRPVVARPKAAPAPASIPAVEDAGAEADAGTGAAGVPVAAVAESEVVRSVPENVQLDIELSGLAATDEVARVGLAAQVPLSAHASGGDTGTGAEPEPDDEEYRPAYSRRSSGADIAEDDIAYDTASIIELVTPEPDDSEPDDSEPDGADADAEASEPDAAHAFGEPNAAEPVTVEPAPVEEAAPLSVAEAMSAHDETTVINGDEPVSAAQPAAASVERPQPFWILAATERDVHDELGAPLFRIGPTAWALVIEDRGGAYVVRHDDGRIGYLHDISDITKG